MSISGAITEAFGKELIHRHLPTLVAKPDCVSVKKNSNIKDLVERHAWINTEALVVKADQGIKRRGAEGLIKLDTDIEGAVEWIEQLHLQDELSSYKHLEQFLVEPFLEHKSNEERYVAIYSELEHDVILFHCEGGVFVGDVDEKASRMRVPLNQPIKAEEIKHSLVQGVPIAQKDKIANFIEKLFALYQELHFTLLEINPFVVRDKIHVLDLTAKLDVSAQPLCQVKWGDTMGWVKKLGRDQLPQEKRVSDMDSVSVGNMKMTLLNKKGRIWTAISGGGISLLLGDTMAKMGCLEALACYSQTSGPLSAKEIYEFMKEIIDLMLEEKSENGKVFITGSQALDFVTLMKLKKMQGEGLFKVLDEYKNKLRAANITVIIRSTVGVVGKKNEKVPDELLSLGIPIYIFGGDVPVEELVNFALNRKPVPSNRPNIYRQLSIPTSTNTPSNMKEDNLSPEEYLFTKNTKIIAVGMIPPAIQGIIDYDFICNKLKPMVAAIVRPHSRQNEERYLWGAGKVSIPVYEDVDQALASHPEVTVVANTAPGPYAYRASWMALQKSQIKCLILSVGDIPLKQIREIIILARQKGVMIIGPTVPKHGLQVNVFKPGAFRYNLFGGIGGPMLDVIDLQLYRPGSVVMLSKSGGLSTELCVAVSRNSDGLYLCISLGGGRIHWIKLHGSYKISP
ncbi:ATP-citrate synthase [Holothuria leucospilota]|uniref:ATP citrate synthase n=1 Tax=Holothuria leucospilota TaxID=206669 RepID=A0A9Q1C5C3_HOLLE|nr:ATP-citrate synthase [Holothuria leucospilota]